MNEIIAEIISEYSDEEKQKLGIPPNAKARGGYWFYPDGRPAGEVKDGKFVPATQQQAQQQSTSPVSASPTNVTQQQSLLTNPPFPQNEIPSNETVMYQRVSYQQGSNPGGIFLGADGKKRYVKLYSNEKQAIGEQIANSIYSAIGIQTTNSFIYSQDGKNITYASDIIEDAVPLQDVQLTEERARKIIDGFVADVLLANWDTVGLSFDNIVYRGPNSTDPIRVDNGGSLLTRAMGGDKPEQLLNNIGEFDTLRNPSMNPKYSRVFTTAGYTEQEFNDKVVDQISKIVKFRDQIGGWENFMNEFNKNQIKTKMPDSVPTHQRRIVEMLEARTEKLIELANGLGANLSSD
jgi:hypothetical protein